MFLPYSCWFLSPSIVFRPSSLESLIWFSTPPDPVHSNFNCFSTIGGRALCCHSPKCCNLFSKAPYLSLSYLLPLSYLLIHFSGASKDFCHCLHNFLLGLESMSLLFGKASVELSNIFSALKTLFLLHWELQLPAIRECKIHSLSPDTVMQETVTLPDDLQIASQMDPISYRVPYIEVKDLTADLAIPS